MSREKSDHLEKFDHLNETASEAIGPRALDDRLESRLNERFPADGVPDPNLRVLSQLNHELTIN
ncbi:MAG: hypothetical protein MJE77_41590 [Proteobacteria bacterium]|nr:hypothetical protein [Pseudomonadota bacterium]